ncbi:hypothetical protein HYA09_001519 [Salmonella enterica]|nr:hypothetical protein [Salmonella enterica]EDS1018812.1 hypothetical protein [Salmonella enterica]EDY0180714.1 hypothetical protein [Salmonella enterica]EDZ2226722.1 hypothetical protein [Salmonella enterica]EEF5181752.1 hypothetical protein [Salmonella enterica]
MTTKNKQALNSDWDLTATERTLKEKKRLGVSDGRMAEILGLTPYLYDLMCDEKPDFKVYEMAEEVQVALNKSGFDLFYILTGEHDSDNYEIMLEAFDHAIADLPLDEQDDMREFVESIFEKFMKATNGGRHSMFH